MLRVGTDPYGANAPDVTVMPVWSETGLSQLAWAEDSRRRVDRMTKGRVAYIYVPNTSLRGYVGVIGGNRAEIGKENPVPQRLCLYRNTRKLLKGLVPRAGVEPARPLRGPGF